MFDKINRCKTCNSKLVFIAEVAAPGIGRTWQCDICDIQYREIGTMLINEEDLDEKDCIMTTSDCI
jgi:transcription elongation factor Elf1